MYKPKEAKLFGAAIKQLLTDRGLSQRQFAKQAGFVDASYVSKLVNPKPGKEIAEPSKKIRQQLAKGFGITEKELLEQIAKYSNSEAEEKISNLPDLAEPEKAIAKSQRTSVESDAGSIEERYFRATSSFDSLKPLERKSRIQVLEEIANNKYFPQYHGKVMEFLADFVRRKAPRKEEEETEERSPKISEDIQAALTVIGRRNWNCTLNLSNTDLRGADLKKANLQGAKLNGANLQRVDFQGADLQGAFLDRANLEGALLTEAKLQRAKLPGANLKALLRAANLQMAILIEADLEAALLSEANLEGALLGRANLQRVLFDGARLKCASFPGAKLQGANFSAAKDLESNQIKEAYGDSTTVLPNDIERPAHWL